MSSCTRTVALGSTKRSLVVVTGKVMAGIDLDAGTSVDVDHDTHRIRIVLPRAKVLGVEVTQLRTYDERSGLWNLFRPADRDTIYQLAREQLVSAAGELGVTAHARRVPSDYLGPSYMLMATPSMLVSAGPNTPAETDRIPATHEDPVPFSGLKLHPDLLRGVRELGFTRPTPIQEAAIPPALSGRDVLACAMTGSGKTAAFLLPILSRLIERPRGVTRALVLTPTRELAAQILEDLNDLAVHTPITGAAIFGGVGMAPQEHAFRSGVDVLVATPGRLLDHFRAPYAKLSGVEYLVLDEADRMLDMGFLPDIRRILRHLPQKRQTLFSAPQCRPHHCAHAGDAPEPGRDPAGS